MSETSKPDKCEKCGQFFTCDLAEGKEKCWCQDFPPVLPLPERDEKCLCPKCLQQEIALKQ